MTLSNIMHLQRLMATHTVVMRGAEFIIEDRTGKPTHTGDWPSTVAAAVGIVREQVEEAERRYREVLALTWAPATVGEDGTIELRPGMHVEGDDWGAEVCGVVEIVGDLNVLVGNDLESCPNKYITHINNQPVRHIDGVRFAVRGEE